MKKVFTLALKVEGHDGTGHKQAARVTLDEIGEVINSTTPIALMVADQLAKGATEGHVDGTYAAVSFEVTDVEFSL